MIYSTSLLLYIGNSISYPELKKWAPFNQVPYYLYNYFVEAIQKA